MQNFLSGLNKRAVILLDVTIELIAEFLYQHSTLISVTLILTTFTLILIAKILGLPL